MNICLLKFGVFFYLTTHSLSQVHFLIWAEIAYLEFIYQALILRTF